MGLFKVNQAKAEAFSFPQQSNVLPRRSDL